MERWFTPEERGVILFLVLVLLTGMCIYLYKLKNPSFAPELKITESRGEQSLSEALAPTGIKDIIPESKAKKFMPKAYPPLAEKPEHEKININKAGIEELMALPGIGPVYAQRIVDYRETHSNFKTPEDLIKIKGIGEKKFQKLKDKITIK